MARLTSFTGFATFNSFNSFDRLSSFTRFTSVKGGEAEKCESGCFATFYIVDWETGVLGVLVCREGRHKGVLDVRRGVPLHLAPVLHTSELCTKVKKTPLLHTGVSRCTFFAAAIYLYSFAPNCNWVS